MPGDTDEMDDGLSKKEKAWEGLPGEIQKLGTALINRDRRASSSARKRRECAGRPGRTDWLWGGRVAFLGFKYLTTST